jgi:hypothetical protein
MGRIHGPVAGQEHEVHAGLPEEDEEPLFLGRRAARIGLVAHHHSAVGLTSTLDEGQLPGVDKAGGWDEADGVSGSSEFEDRVPQLVDAADDLHA